MKWGHFIADHRHKRRTLRRETPVTSRVTCRPFGGVRVHVRLLRRQFSGTAATL
jgi:hypothetical protein